MLNLMDCVAVISLWILLMPAKENARTLKTVERSIDTPKHVLYCFLYDALTWEIKFSLKEYY